MKKIIIILAVLAALLPNIVLAKTSISIGTKFNNNLDSSNEATIAYNATRKLGYTAYLSTIPTKSVLSDFANKFKNGGTNGIMFFHGHANSSSIIWNYEERGGKYSVGITKNNSMSGIDGYDYLSISEFTPSNASLAIFMGCETTKNTSNNIALTAYNQGAKSTIGFDKTIYEGDTDKWTNRFFEKLSNGSSVESSFIYANGFNDYQYLLNMKSARRYGNQYIAFSSYNKSNEKSYSLTDSITQKEKIYNINANQKFTIENIINYIKETFNKSFDPNKYIYIYNYNGNEEIYSFNLLIDGIQSDIGYTVIVTNNKLHIFDNMKEYNENTNTQNKLKSSIKFDENLAIEKTINKYKNINSDIEITFDSSKKYYKTAENKFYFDVNLKYYNKKLETTSIITDTYEIL